MRVLGAIAISLSGAVASFIGVLAALEAPPSTPRDTRAEGRIAGFAVPALADALATLEPGRHHKAAAIAASGGAWVPPIVRKRPVDPDAPPAVASAKPLAPTPVARAPVPVPAPRIARAKRPANPAFDEATRSALGGPRPTTPTATR